MRRRETDREREIERGKEIFKRGRAGGGGGGRGEADRQAVGPKS